MNIDERMRAFFIMFKPDIQDLIRDSLEEVAKDQRQRCADECKIYMRENTGMLWGTFIDGVQNACLNAAEKSNG